jgi:hypothetical protein
METARTIFAERLYNWTMEEWRQEISDDFPLLTEMEKGKVVNAHEMLEIMKTFEKDQQWLMARAFVRRFCISYIKWASQFQKSWVYSLDKFTETEKDKQLFELYIDMSRKISFNEDKSEYSQWETAKNKLKRPKLRRYIIENLRPVIGERNKQWSNSCEFVYMNPIGKFLIMTWIDTGGRYHQLSYHHVILDPGYPDAIVSKQTPKAPLSQLSSWIGLSMWDLLLDKDAEPTAKLLTKLIPQFMNAASKLLEGLSPDD